jgi:hypothetical protein
LVVVDGSDGDALDAASDGSECSSAGFQDNLVIAGDDADTVQAGMNLRDLTAAQRQAPDHILMTEPVEVNINHAPQDEGEDGVLSGAQR